MFFFMGTRMSDTDILACLLHHDYNNNNNIILYFRHLSIYTIKQNYKKYVHTIKK